MAMRLTVARRLVLSRTALGAPWGAHMQVSRVGYYPIRWNSQKTDAPTQLKKDVEAKHKELLNKAGASPEAAKSSDAVVAADKEKEVKPTLWQKVKKEAKHYWDGTKLLGYEIKVSTKLTLKMASGQKLSRRENRQLKRTVQDIARLVPFSVFVLVPFAELLLPIALKLFPNMLPSTYETSKSKEAKRLKLSNERERVSQFLKSTLEGNKGNKFVPTTHTEEQRQKFDEFMTLVERHESVPHQLVLEVCHLFRDDVLLDNMTRPQLASLARYMNLQPFGTSTVVRYLIRHRLVQIKQDDYVIDREGVDSLNSQEIVSAARARGFNTSGVSVGRLKSELSAWLQLRLHERVPSSLLLLANTLNYGVHDLDSYYDALSAAIGSLPDQVYHEAELEVKEESATNEERLEVLKEQDVMIDNENKEDDESGSVIRVDDLDDCDDPKCDDDSHNHTNPKHPDNEPEVKAEANAEAKPDGKSESKQASP